MVRAANRDLITLSDNVIDLHIDAVIGLASQYQIVNEFAAASCYKAARIEVSTLKKRRILALFSSINIIATP